MPSTCCCVPNCSNRGGHVFLKNEKIKKKWIRAIKRNMNGNKYQLWKPSKISVVCKLHFLPSDYKSETTCGTVALVKRLKSDAFPSVFPWISTSTSNDRTVRQAKRNEAKDIIDSDSCSESSEDMQANFLVMMLMLEMKFITQPNHVPRDFKTKFPSTRIIIDGTECPVMKPKSPIAQQSTFSTDKNRNNIKLLVGAIPGGLINYVSPTYGGSTSNRQICE
ncbi:unnamed protein product [Mytilus coruscus]|uniref:THAP-type domain-containing protein n=1 Tax=Mytilus coruscus TaxID=42192 RepID=A0A6J8C4N5_MYTCO|nr:unnamed protein product [Mytilus coruscus]